MPYSKKITINLYELRIKGKQEIRLFYTYKNNKIIILSGFIKQTNKTPKNEIQKALNKIKSIDI